MSQTVVKVKNLSFTYSGNDRPALSGVNFSIQAGEWIAIIGPNGSGKSTLARLINGLLAPNEGEVEILQTVLNEETVWQARRSVGMVFQNPDNQFVGATVEDDVAFGLENNGVPREEMLVRVADALEQVRMQAFKDFEPSRLSGGQKQRVALAGVIAMRPDIVILDEATAMLDPKGRREVLEAVYQMKETYDLTVISITHDIDEASQADRVFVMEAGRLVQEDRPQVIFSMGEALIERGLDLPFTQKLQQALLAEGLDVPQNYLEEEELIAWIRSYLTK